MAINEKMKWPFDKARYDKNYLRLWGKKCHRCASTGSIVTGRKIRCCPECNGIGYTEK